MFNQKKLMQEIRIKDKVIRDPSSHLLKRLESNITQMLVKEYELDEEELIKLRNENELLKEKNAMIANEMDKVKKENDRLKFENVTLSEELKKRVDSNLKNEAKAFAMERRVKEI